MSHKLEPVAAKPTRPAEGLHSWREYLSALKPLPKKIQADRALSIPRLVCRNCGHAKHWGRA
jgi:hypothetical protein